MTILQLTKNIETYFSCTYISHLSEKNYIVDAILSLRKTHETSKIFPNPKCTDVQFNANSIKQYNLMSTFFSQRGGGSNMALLETPIDKVNDCWTANLRMSLIT